MQFTTLLTLLSSVVSIQALCNAPHEFNVGAKGNCCKFGEKLSNSGHCQASPVCLDPSKQNAKGDCCASFEFVQDGFCHLTPCGTYGRINNANGSQCICANGGVDTGSVCCQSGQISENGLCVTPSNPTVPQKEYFAKLFGAAEDANRMIAGYKFGMEVTAAYRAEQLALSNANYAKFAPGPL